MWSKRRVMRLASDTAVLLLAAGAGRRLGQSKLQLRLGETTLAERMLSVVHALAPQRILLTLGAHAAQDADYLRSLVIARSAELLHVHDHHSGMAASIRAGAAELAKDAAIQRVLILLIDQWRVQPMHLQALLELSVQQPTCAVASRYQECANADAILGAPAVFPRSQFVHLMQLQGDHGARALLREESTTLCIDCAAPGDVDSLADSQAAVAELARQKRAPAAG
jgi:molybdenum cofactor cytidylyltransferase